MKYKISGDAEPGYLLTLSNIRSGEQLDGQKIVVKTGFNGGSEVEVPFEVNEQPNVARIIARKRAV